MTLRVSLSLVSRVCPHHHHHHHPLRSLQVIVTAEVREQTQQGQTAALLGDGVVAVVGASARHCLSLFLHQSITRT